MDAWLVLGLIILLTRGALCQSDAASTRRAADRADPLAKYRIGGR